MELRQYWHVLVRRRNVVLYTFLVVAVLSLITVGYSYYNSRYLGETQIGLQVQPESVRNAVVDPQSAADANTGQVESDIANYAGTNDYFQAISDELAHGTYMVKVHGVYQAQRYKTHINNWKTIRNGLKVFRATDGHSIFIEWESAKSTEAADAVRAAAAQLIDYIPVYHQSLRPTSPPIKYSYVDAPNSASQGLSKPAINFVLRAALGVVAGIILAYLFEYLDDTVQDEADVRRWLGVPALAVIPGGRQNVRVRGA